MTLSLAAKDIRIEMTRLAALVLFAINGVICLSADISLIDKIFCVAMTGAFVLTVLAGIRFLRRDRSAALLFCVMAAFVGVAYYLKFALILHMPDLVWGADRVVMIRDVPDRILPMMYELVPATLLLMLGLCMGPKLPTIPASRKRTPTHMRTSSVAAICAVLLVVKLVSLVFFGVGSPVTRGQGLPLLIIALLEFITQDATIVTLNLLFYSALYLGRGRLASMIAGALVGSVLISLMAGWKGELVFQVFVFIYIYFEFIQTYSRKQQRTVLTWGVLAVVALVIVYPSVNHYRQELKRSDSFSDALDFDELLEAEIVGDESTVVSIFRRVSGIGTYYSAMQLGAHTKLSASAMWDAQLGQMLKRAMFGADSDRVLVGFGASQFAALNLIGGTTFLYLGALLFGLGIRLVSALIGRILLSYSVTYLALAQFLSLSWINMMLAGGNLSLKLKELIVVVGMLVIAERLLFVRTQGNQLASSSRVVRTTP